MNIIRNSEQLKQAYSAVDVDFDLNSIKSFMDDADIGFIIPFIGRETFDKIISLNEGTETYQKVIIALLRKAEAYFTIHLYASAGSVNISDAGISVTKTDKSLPASDKKLVALKSDTIETGYNALFAALDQIEVNKSALDYANSQERKNNLALFVNNAREFETGGININRSNNLYHLLRTYQVSPEVERIEPILGSKVTQTLRSGILDGNLTPIYKELLKKVTRAVVQLTMAEAIPYRAVSVSTNGIFTVNYTDGGSSGNIENRNPANDKLLQGLMSKCVNAGEIALTALENFLNENAEEFEIPPKGEPININEPDSKLYYM